jgi:hypothetical protein
MAFIVCALIMYMLWWDKPFGVERRTTLTVITHDLDVKKWLETALGAQSRADHIHDLTLDGLLNMPAKDMGSSTREDLRDVVYAFRSMVKNIFKKSTIYPPRKASKSITFYTTSTLFSALHISAWNWDFPSSIARTLWRTFGVAATGTGPFTIFLLVFISGSTDDFAWKSVSAIILLFGLIYIVSRLGLVVLIFYCFSSMPAGVYETVAWTTFLPHFS